jgi:ribonuclease III
MAQPTRRAAAVHDLQERLGWRFHDADLLEQALTHASVGDRQPDSDNNERLEFLGDRVLGLIVAEILFQTNPDLPEGDLSVRFNQLVSRTACAEAARRAGLGAALRIGGSESKQGGRDKAVILADACEAVLAAAYLDGGLGAARTVVTALWGEALTVAGQPAQKDVKTRLQEWAHADGRQPRYSVLTRSGPSHAPTFTVELDVPGVAPVTGAGSSRRAAERAAAEAMLAREGVQ